MSAQGILILFLVFFLLKLGWATALSLLNLKEVRRNGTQVPKAFAGVVDEVTYSRSVSYTLTKGRFAVLVEGVTSAATLAVILSGLFGVIDDAVRNLPVAPYLQGVVVVGLVSLLFWIISLPFSLYSTFSIESRFGFNRTTPALYAIDTLKGFALASVIGIPVLLALFWFMDKTGAYWWLWAFAAMTLLQIVMSILAPLVIAPLFNKFTPLPDGELKSAILSLAERLKFRTRGIFVVDSSKRSGHSNAYFTGLGRVKRIVLFDTLVSSHSQEEILSVLAHEIGHEKRNHVTKGIALSVVLSLAGFWVMSLLLNYHPLYQAFGFHRMSYAAMLVLVAFCSGPFVFFLQPLFSLWSRKHEYEADRFAVEALGSAGGMKEALLRLSRHNLSNLTPHPLYSFFYYSHPTLAERIAALDEAERARAAR